MLEICKCLFGEYSDMCRVKMERGDYILSTCISRGEVVTDDEGNRLVVDEIIASMPNWRCDVRSGVFCQEGGPFPVEQFSETELAAMQS